MPFFCFWCVQNPFLWISAQLPWMGGCGTVSAVMCRPCSACPGKAEKLRRSSQRQFYLPGFPWLSIWPFLCSKFPSPASACTQLWNLGVGSRQFLSQLFHGLQGQEEPTQCLFHIQVCTSLALLGSLLCPGFPNPSGGWAALGLKPCLATRCISKLWL